MVLSLLAKENNLFRVLIIHASLWESKSYETEMFFNASFNGFAVIFSGFSPWEIRAKQFAQHPPIFTYNLLVRPTTDIFSLAPSPPIDFLLFITIPRKLPTPYQESNITQINPFLFSFLG